MTEINVKNARLDEHLIFHEMEVASHFNDPQLVTVKGLAYIPHGEFTRMKWFYNI